MNWRRQHKWSSLLALLPLLSLCLSGIILNHRQLLRSIDVSRTILPPQYRYHDWNGGLLRGSIAFDSSSTVLYGNSGLWLLSNGRIDDFNQGLPEVAEARNFRGAVRLPDDKLLCVSTESLYSLEEDGWKQFDLSMDAEERLTDIYLHEDTLIVMSRSRLYAAVAPYRDFRAFELAESKEGRQKPSAFKAFFLLHSGQLFGQAGIVLVDIMAVILALLCVTGLVIFLMPRSIRRLKNKSGIKIRASALRLNVKIHRKIGVWTFVLTMLVCFTGFCLRPPLLILLASSKVPALPGTVLSDPNPWHDKLRMIRHDDNYGWIISTSDGFYSLKTLDSRPEKCQEQVPVSVMGLNVWEPLSCGRWLCGSFSGLYIWDIANDEVIDYYTGEKAEAKAGPPFGRKPVAGFAKLSDGSMVIADYESGCSEIAQPASLSALPMSLWNVALEMHTGRLWFGKSATWFYIMLVGLLVLWSLVSGYMVGRKTNKR